MIKKYKRKHAGYMRRTSRIFLVDLNKGKREKLYQFLLVYANVVRYFITMLWSRQDFSPKLNYEDIKKGIERFKVRSHLISCAYKQAKEIVNSQKDKSKRKRRMPHLKNVMANLNGYHFFKLEKFDGSFDWCLKFYTKLNWGEKVIIPFNNTKHTLKFLNDNWLIANSIRLGVKKRGKERKIFIDLIFEKERPKWKEEGEVVGVDLGYRNLIATSDRQLIGTDLKEKIEKAGKRRKAFHHYIQTEINKYLKQLPFDKIKVLVLEKLKNVKYKTRGKLSRKVNRFLSFWHYAKAIQRLRQLCEENGVRLVFKSPYKTSQTCPLCGKIDRKNRKADKFKCTNCGFEEQADIVSAMNLKALWLAGAYSLGSLQSNFNGGQLCK